jgi:hypothetical protein
VLFLKPLKVLHTLDSNRLAGDSARHEIKRALGLIRQTRPEAVKAIFTYHPAIPIRLEEAPAFYFRMPAAVGIRAE